MSFDPVSVWARHRPLRGPLHPNLATVERMMKSTSILTLASLSLLWPALAGEYQPPLNTSDGFAVPQPGHRFEFPRDYGSHADFAIEWWYLTGHLYSEQNRRFGFQATFFRRTGPLSTNKADGPAGAALFGHGELHLAHMALLDVGGQQFIHEERLNREGWDAAASSHTLDVRNGNWSLRLDTNNATTVLVLQGSVRAEAAFSLKLIPAKPLVVFGREGVSRKGAALTAASYYLTFPRLQASGQVTVQGQPLAVHGQVWMDHEISSSQLDRDQAGWDWTGIQLKDGREIMAYRMRKKDGRTDPFSTLAWVDAQGAVTHFGPDRFTWSAARTWKSRRTGGVYPVETQLTTIDPANGQSVTFTLEPLCLDQELSGALGGVSYWEGACRVLNGSRQEVGSAYLELTGYTGDLSDHFR
jgi:predicted secreted hydrolase